MPTCQAWVGHPGGAAAELALAGSWFESAAPARPHGWQRRFLPAAALPGAVACSCCCSRRAVLLLLFLGQGGGLVALWCQAQQQPSRCLLWWWVQHERGGRGLVPGAGGLAWRGRAVCEGLQDTVYL